MIVFVDESDNMQPISNTILKSISKLPPSISYQFHQNHLIIIIHLRYSLSNLIDIVCRFINMDYWVYFGFGKGTTFVLSHMFILYLLLFSHS